MLYLTHTRLMLESEQAINENAVHGAVVAQRVCTQLLHEPTRYGRWHVRHDRGMTAVAGVRTRPRQVLALRAFALEQIHGSALVRYLRDNRVVGEERDRTLRVFYGVLDSREAAVMAHRDYLLAASSQLCALELLGLASDGDGAELLTQYEQAYSQYFSMFCEAARAKECGEPYILASLLPEVRLVADNLRRRVLEQSTRRGPRLVMHRLIEHGARARG